MANVLPFDRQVSVISMLAEGSSIRSIERVTGVHRDTVMRLGVRVGQGCARLLDRQMRNLSCARLQLDELWGFIAKKARHVTDQDAPGTGDIWTFVAVDADSKIVPTFRVGNRDANTANAFVADLASRLRNRVQLSSDALKAYVDAVERGFGGEVDYGQIVKSYATSEPLPASSRYSPPPILSTRKTVIAGHPELEHVSTSFIEKLNHITRMHCRRLTRLTNGFSKRLENFKAAVGLNYGSYNLVKIHKTLRMTPAMAAGVVPELWDVADLILAADAA
jgi:IS1 family transposase